MRISAGMVGILLNSCSPRENSNDLHLSLGFVLRNDDESSNELRRASQNC